MDLEERYQDFFSFSHERGEKTRLSALPSFRERNLASGVLKPNAEGVREAPVDEGR